MDFLFRGNATSLSGGAYPVGFVQRCFVFSSYSFSSDSDHPSPFPITSGLAAHKVIAFAGERRSPSPENPDRFPRRIVIAFTGESAIGYQENPQVDRFWR